MTTNLPAAEQAIEPELPICDPHHHLFTQDSGIGVPMERSYLLDDLAADMNSGHDIRVSVFIECGTKYDEGATDPELGQTRWVAGLAAQSDVVRGIVGITDLRRDDVADALAAHVEAGGGYFRGVRHRASMFPGASLSDPAFRRGAAALAAAGLTLDMLNHSPHIDELTELAAACPETTFILNHLAVPSLAAGERSEALALWRREIGDIAKLDNVMIKLGGIGIPGFAPDVPADRVQSDFLVEQWGDIIRYCIDAFGPDRSMFESNYPVDALAGYSYSALWNAFKKISTDYDSGERSALFYDTAVRVYRLPDAA